MTRDQAKQLLPIITAFANGEEIQFKMKHESADQWATVPDPTFQTDEFDYRIKPKPREFQIALNSNGSVYYIYSADEKVLPIGLKFIRVREILD